MRREREEGESDRLHKNLGKLLRLTHLSQFCSTEIDTHNPQPQPRLKHATENATPDRSQFTT